MRGLKAIIVQECYDSKGVGQPEIIEKARKCEALGAEVLQLTVGPELFYEHLSLMEDSGYFNASLYSSIQAWAGVETLGYEIGREVLERYGKEPAMAVCTYAGGGMVTGTARGLDKCGCRSTEIIGRLHRSDGASHGVGCSVQQKVLHDRPYGFWHSSCDEPGQRRHPEKRRPGRCGTWTAMLRSHRVRSCT